MVSVAQAAAAASPAPAIASKMLRKEWRIAWPPRLISWEWALSRAPCPGWTKFDRNHRPINPPNGLCRVHDEPMRRSRFRRSGRLQAPPASSWSGPRTARQPTWVDDSFLKAPVRAELGAEIATPAHQVVGRVGR